MSLFYRIGLATLLVSAAFASGFFYGRSIGREVALQSAIVAFQARERIDYEIENFDDVDLCVALGGMRDECAAFMRGVDKAAAGEQSALAGD